MSARACASCRRWVAKPDPLVWLLVLASALGCGTREVELAPDLLPHPANNGSGAAIPDLQSLRVTPASDEVTFDGRALADKPVFRAFGSFPAGERDVTREVAWTLSRPELGSITAGRFETAAIGGTTDVLARAGDSSASAWLTIRLDVVQNRGLDAATVAAFAAGAEERGSGADPPLLVYPSSDTVVPSNLENVLKGRNITTSGGQVKAMEELFAAFA